MGILQNYLARLKEKKQIEKQEKEYHKKVEEAIDKSQEENFQRYFDREKKRFLMD
jgi:hypothetical protein